MLWKWRRKRARAGGCKNVEAYLVPQFGKRTNERGERATTTLLASARRRCCWWTRHRFTHLFAVAVAAAAAAAAAANVTVLLEFSMYWNLD